jgi:hypothetical protein
MMHNEKEDQPFESAGPNPIRIPDNYNYIAVFLTLDCPLRCSYCINRFGGEAGRPQRMLSGREWVLGLNRLVTRPDLPITLQGGEPSLHPDFYDILAHLRPDINIDLLTNLEFDVEEFITRVDPRRIKREAPYASIRVSYHPEMMDLAALIKKVLRLQDAGFSVGIWGVLHPDQEQDIHAAQERARKAGIDFRTKEFLGKYKGKLHGSYKYPGACDGHRKRPVECRTTELLIGPSGGVYRCHSDLYNGRGEIGHMTDPDFVINEIFRPCEAFGSCNPCDVKIKTNRFQVDGHTSVEIRG